MRKKKVKMSELGKTNKRGHLIMVHPFLRNSYRKITQAETTSEKVFVELFGTGVTFEYYKLEAVHEFQK
jgi:hypothetical protein